MTTASQFVEVQPTVKRFLEREHGLLIGGRWVPASDGRRFDVEDPATGKVIATAAAGNTADVDAAVRAARAAFDGPWSRMTPPQRTRLLLRLADLIEANAAEIALIETHDVGQPAWLSVAGAAGAPDVVRYFAGWSGKIGGETVTPNAAGEWHAYTVREPMGVVGLIVPWNSPFGTTIHKLAALLAAGCTTVIKPAEETPLSTIRLGELVQEAGFPEGVVNIVTGFGETAGAALVAHDGVDKISFTGSTETGKAILRASAGTMKRVTLELGGKSPVIIMPDADLDKAIEATAGGIFLNSGQICVAGSRLFAHRKVYDRIVEGVAARAAQMRVGPGTEAETQMGPLVSRTQLDRVMGYVESGRKEGAEVVAGGTRLGEDGYFLQPTVLADTQSTMAVMREEIFGPVLCATAFDDETIDQIAAEANNTIYGLAACIWTRDLSAAHKLARRIKAGTVKINTREFPENTLPFGGFKQSGFGRERGRAGVEMYTEVKSVLIGL